MVASSEQSNKIRFTVESLDHVEKETREISTCVDTVHMPASLGVQDMQETRCRGEDGIHHIPSAIWRYTPATLASYQSSSRAAKHKSVDCRRLTTRLQLTEVSRTTTPSKFPYPLRSPTFFPRPALSPSWSMGRAKPGLEPLATFIHDFQVAIDYRSYRLDDRSQYNSTDLLYRGSVSKIIQTVRKVVPQLRSIDGNDPILLLSFLRLI